MKNLFKFIKSDDPMSYDDEYVYVKDKTVTIQNCGGGMYFVNKWSDKERIMYHSDLMTLSNAMNLVINKKYNGANK
jgi:hypothetical protein